MKLYITQETEQEIEDKIAELEDKFLLIADSLTSMENQGRLDMLKEILSSASILPVEESWYDTNISAVQPEQKLGKTYPNGVIIQPK